MQYWEDGAALTLIGLGGLLAATWGLARAFPVLARLGVPLAIVAGLGGLVLGEQVLDLVRLRVDLLEAVVYHGLAVVFIAVGLKAPSTGGRTRGARSMAFAIVAMLGGQATIGLLVLTLLDPTLHPGIGLLLPMGFEEGPGQALSMGAAWGIEDGAQIGLIIAVIGYGWAVFAGVPLAIVRRLRQARDGAASAAGSSAAGSSAAGSSAAGSSAAGSSAAGSSAAGSSAAGSSAPGATAGSSTAGSSTARAASAAAAGGLDALTVQLGIIATCYLLTWAACRLLSTLLTGMPDIAAMIWGFHFIIGAGVAMLLRPLVARLPGPAAIDEEIMGRICGMAVDLVTCAALAAVRIGVLRQHWLPIVAVTTAGGLWTLLFCLWAGRRAWREASFEHTVLWFGMSTGTLPTGLALLKVVDPELKSPAAVSAVFGSAAALLGLAPLMLGLIPAAVATHDAPPGARWLMVAALLGYWTLVMVLWRAVGGLRFRYRVAAS